MKKIQLACLVSIFSIGSANALTPCDAFQIKIKNELLDDLMVSTVKLSGATIQPSGLQQLDSKGETVFTVNGSDANTPMTGEMIFHTISLPSKTVHLNFDLSNQLLICEHTDRSTNKNYSIGIFRQPGQVTYTISN